MSSTVSRVTDERSGAVVLIPVAAATVIPQGTIVCRNAAGYAVPGSDTAGLVAVGIAAEAIDNTAGAAGDLSVQVYRNRAFLLNNDAANPVTIALVGTAGAAVIKDNDTVCVVAGAANDIPIGRPIEITSAGIWIEFP